MNRLLFAGMCLVCFAGAAEAAQPKWGKLMDTLAKSSIESWNSTIFAELPKIAGVPVRRSMIELGECSDVMEYTPPTSPGCETLFTTDEEFSYSDSDNPCPDFSFSEGKAIKTALCDCGGEKVAEMLTYVSAYLLCSFMPDLDTTTLDALEQFTKQCKMVDGVNDVCGVAPAPTAADSGVSAMCASMATVLFAAAGHVFAF